MKQKNKGKDLGKLQKQANNSCNMKQFLTVQNLSEFGLIRKLGQQLRFAKRINSNGVIKFEL